MVGVKMGYKNPLEFAVGQIAREHRFPLFNGRRHEKAGVDERIAGLTLVQ